METAGHRLRDRDEQEVRHRDHALHRVEHVDDDPGPVRPVRDVVLRPGQPQHGLHRDLHLGEHPQDLRAEAVLLQGALERLRLCRRHTLHPR